MVKGDCLFCKLYEEDKEFVYENRYFYAQLDAHPINPGHILIIPKRHVVSFFDLEPQELTDWYSAMQDVKRIIDEQHGPAAYNIGVNDGVEAGRTVHHLHFHLIPRYKGDVQNPRGGVRNIIPGKGDYTKTS